MSVLHTVPSSFCIPSFFFSFFPTSVKPSVKSEIRQQQQTNKNTNKKKKMAPFRPPVTKPKNQDEDAFEEEWGNYEEAMVELGFKNESDQLWQLRSILSTLQAMETCPEDNLNLSPEFRALNSAWELVYLRAAEKFEVKIQDADKDLAPCPDDGAPCWLWFNPDKFEESRSYSEKRHRKAFEVATGRAKADEEDEEDEEDDDEEDRSWLVDFYKRTGSHAPTEDHVKDFGYLVTLVLQVANPKMQLVVLEWLGKCVEVTPSFEADVFFFQLPRLEKFYFGGPSVLGQAACGIYAARKISPLLASWALPQKAGAESESESAEGTRPLKRARSEE
jgi:hypothetical protein